MIERFDPKFVLGGGHHKLRNVNTELLGNLTRSEPDYGANVRAIPMKSCDGVKYIRITDFDEDGISPDHEFVTAELIEDKYRLEKDDLLFARSGATAGKTFIYAPDIGPAIFAGYCIRFRFDLQRVLPWFVYYYTKTTRYNSWVRSIQRPSGQPNINKQEFKSFSLPLPDLDVQARLIAELDDARDARRAKLAQADALLAGLDGFVLERLGLTLPVFSTKLAYAVKLADVQCGQLNSDYFHPERLEATRAITKSMGYLRAEPLEKIADFIRDHTSAKNEPRYIGLANVQGHTGELLETEDEQPDGQCFKFIDNDVLFARLRPYLNKVYRAEKSGVCSTEFHVVRVKQQESRNILPDYLAAILRSSLTLAQTRHMMTGNTHPRLANEDVVKLLIPIASLEVQAVITAEVIHRREEARRLRAEAEAVWQAAQARFEAQLLGGAV